MSGLDSAALFKRYASTFATLDPELIVELHAPDTQFWLHTGGPAVHGRAAVRDTFAMFFEQWPGFGFDVVRLITGDRHWVLDWALTATLTDPDGRQRPVRFDCLDVVTFDDTGLVLRKDTYVDYVQAQTAVDVGVGGCPSMRPGSLDEVRLGMVLPCREAEMGGRRDLRDLLALAVTAEAAGLDSLWVGDSPVARPRAEPFGLLGAVAARTETIGLGTAALLPALRHPLHSAHAIATLDQLAPGRLTLAVGAGFPNDATGAEFAAFGVPFSARSRRLDRHVELWRALWSGDASAASAAAKALDLTATDEALAALPSPMTPGGPEIWLAAGPSRPNADRVVRLYDGWLPYVPTADGYRQGREAIEAIEAIEASTRRSPDRPQFGLYVTLTLGPEPAAAAAEQNAYLEAYYGIGAAVVSTLQVCHAGDSGSAVDLLGSYIAAGVRHLVVRLAAFDPEPQLRLLVDEVIPKVRSR